MNVISEHEMLSQYDDHLDEYGDVEICGMQYCASYALKQVDPVAYTCGFNDYLDACDYVEHLDEDGGFDGWVQADDVEGLDCEGGRG